VVEGSEAIGTAKTVVHGGRLALQTNRIDSNLPAVNVVLAGGDFLIDNVYKGVVQVNAPATISSFIASNFSRRGQPGQLVGSQPIALGGLLDMVTASPEFSGDIMVEGAIVVRHPKALGSGQVTIADGATLDLAIPESGPLQNHIFLEGGKITTDSEVGFTPMPGRLLGNVIVKSNSSITTNFRDPIEILGTLELKDGTQIEKLEEGLLDVSGSLQVGSDTRFATGPGFLRRNDGSTINDHLSEVRITGTIKSAAPQASINFVRSGFDNLNLVPSVYVETGQSLEILENGSPIEFALGAGESISGGGMFRNPIRLKGGTISPGQSPGRLDFGDLLTIGPGTTYVWEVNNAIGEPGQLSGWDFFHVTETIAFETTMADPFVLRVVGLNEANQNGPIPNFDPRVSYQWLIASADFVSGFDTTAIRIDIAALKQTYPAMRDSSFSIYHSDGDLFLTYVGQIPEPNTAILIVLSLAIWLSLRRIRPLN
jgi:hypothetical protein